MVQQIINGIASGIVPILIAALVAVLTVVIKGVGDAAVAYLSRKKDALIAKIGADTYDHDLAVARSIWGVVDEEFRITPTLEKTIANKQALFAEKTKRVIPGITDDEIEQLRQAVAGEINKGRVALAEPATAGQQATTPPVAPVVGTVDPAAAESAPTGAQQAAAVKQDTALFQESGAVTSGTTGAV